ncbi:hypothetical protein LPTSP2_31790 [Leptospira ellinghausenii]|uniref:Uncharacterized protein n=1 Tax=Leptospira ellinghausenii TaxID=1917822 RepID=A0A2P2DGW9_9LEPT|nr:hypothetical protein LPTSP2_31790 [Leptospira ellinghausenii]
MIEVRFESLSFSKTALFLGERSMTCTRLILPNYESYRKYAIKKWKLTLSQFQMTSSHEIEISRKIVKS